MTFHLRDGNKVIVLPSGRIDYRSVTGRTYRNRGRGEWTYGEAVAFVRRSAWGRDVRYVTGA